MADNFVTDAGSGGDTFGADDVGGVKFPRLKLIIGADGTNDGDVASGNPLPVTGTVTANLSATDNAVLDAIQAAVEIVDDWDESDRAKVNLVVGQAGIAAGAGAVGVTVPRVTLASDDPAVADLAAIEVILTAMDSDTSALAGCVGGTEVQVDVVSSALPTGAATAANQATLIGHVDGVEALLAGGLPAALGAGGGLKVDGSGTALPVSGTVTVNAGTNLNTSALALEAGGNLATIAGDTTSIDGKLTACNTGAVVLAAGVAIIGSVGIDQTTPGTTNAVVASIAAAQTLATVTTVGTLTTITNVVHVDDNAGSLTVDGAVTANAGTNLNTSALALEAGGNLAAIATDAAAIEVLLGTIDADTSALAGAVAGTEVQVDIVAALPAGTNAIGKLAANSGVDIGDVDVTSIAAGTNTIGGVIAQTSTSAAYDGTTACAIKRLSGIATSSGANTIIAAVADKKIRVLALSLIATSITAVVLYVYNGDYMLFGDGTNKVTLDMDGVGGPAGLVLPFNIGGWFQTDTANEALAVNLGGATPVIWAVTYIEVA